MPNLPEVKISAWIRLLERTHLSHINDETVKRRLRNYYIKNHVIKAKDIPDSYFQNQIRLARNRGLGTKKLNDEVREELSNILIRDQTQSIVEWFDYYMSEDSSSIPAWAKYWSFTSMLKMADFDKENSQFKKRSKKRVGPYPELNREILPIILDKLKAQFKKNPLQNLSQKEIKEIFLKINFSKMYAEELSKALQYAESKNKNLGTEGKWTKFAEGSNPSSLVRSLRGKHTGWCTAGTATAKVQLEGGEFYIYYSIDDKGSYTMPRIAIRIQGGAVAEIRGVAKDQHLDAEMLETSILSEKLKEFGPETEKTYNKKTENMKRLTEIESRHQAKDNLSKSDLKFLYELDEPVVGFGYGSDPRVEEIISERDVKKDISYALDIKEDQVSVHGDEVFSGNVVYHHGDLTPNKAINKERITLPKAMKGRSIIINGVKNGEGLVTPPSTRLLHLSGITNAKGLVITEGVDDIKLNGLTSGDGLVLPASTRHLLLNDITSTEGLAFSDFIDHLELDGFTSGKGLIIPPSVVNLFMNGLKSTEGLILPPSVKVLYANGIKKAEDLSRYDKVILLFLNGIKSAEGLVLPAFTEHIALNGLASTKGLVVPPSVEFIELDSIEKKDAEEFLKKYSGAARFKDQLYDPNR